MCSLLSLFSAFHTCINLVKIVYLLSQNKNILCKLTISTHTHTHTYNKE